MKKFYAFAAAAFIAVSAFAQDGAPLYMVGAGEGLGWDPAAPAELTYADGVYTIEVNSLSQFKLSTAMGDWETFNSQAIGCSNYGDTPGVVVALEPWGENTKTPWEGDYKVTVAGDLSTIILATDTPKPTGATPLYFRGDLEGTEGWSAVPEWQFELIEGTNVYKFVCAEGQSIMAGTSFKIADGSWNEFNFGFENDGDVLLLDCPTPLWNNGNSNNMSVDEDFEGVCYMDVVEALVFMSNDKNAENPFGSSVKNITVENGAAVYYNLQGVRVNNAEKGLFIVVKDGKAVKVVK